MWHAPGWLCRLSWPASPCVEPLRAALGYDLDEMDTTQREKLSGQLYTFEGVPASVAFLSILDGDGDNPMRRVAFPRNGVWHYRTKEALPHAVLLWMHDGQSVTTAWRAI
jgi:hypothetical protein